jgi:hypothetical protein
MKTERVFQAELADRGVFVSRKSIREIQRDALESAAGEAAESLRKSDCDACNEWMDQWIANIRNLIPKEPMSDRPLLDVSAELASYADAMDMITDDAARAPTNRPDGDILLEIEQAASRARWLAYDTQGKRLEPHMRQVTAELLTRLVGELQRRDQNAGSAIRGPR